MNRAPELVVVYVSTTRLRLEIMAALGVGGVLTVLGAAGIVTTSLYLSSGSETVRTGHVLVADAGSTHTDFNIYRWTVETTDSTANDINLCCGGQEDFKVRYFAYLKL